MIFTSLIGGPRCLGSRFFNVCYSFFEIRYIEMKFAGSLFLALACYLFALPATATERPNFLIITVDDMNADSVGVFGCPLKETTPNIDRLAKSSLRFTRAHVQVGNCMPSRNVMWSGLYPHNNGVEGFYQVPDAKFPTLTTLMKSNGYFTAIRNKVTHSSPYQPYPWDLVLDEIPDGRKLHIKDPESYGESTTRGIEAARKANKPFCLVINISDPHKPFFAQGAGGKTIPDPHVPSRVFHADEVPVPGFLFDDPVVRKELAHYYSSVRRADDAVGSILRSLHQAGADENTFVMFLSDHGMPLPFAKTQLYHHSTRTPLMIRWPGVTKPGSVDRKHMVSAVDFFPTLLDVAGIEKPRKLDGRSFESVLHGREQSGRDKVFKEYNENAGGSRDPIRAIQTTRYLYLFNPWSNGSRVFATATSGTQTYRRMVQLAATDPKMNARLRMYKYRVVEELYDVENDPDCLVNLVDSAEHRPALDALRIDLENWMVRTGDPMLPVFRNRSDPEVREKYVQEKEQESAARRKNRKKKQSGKPKPSRKKLELIQLDAPKAVAPGSEFTVTIRYALPENLNKQQVHVTTKAGKRGKRLERKVITVSGQGTQTVRFQLPAKLEDNRLLIAAFVGPSYAKNLQYLTTKPIPVK